MSGRLPGLPSIRAGTRPVTSYRMRTALEPPLDRRAPSRTTATRRVTRVVPGRAELQVLSSIEIRRSGRNRVAAGWLESCPERNLTIFEIAPQGDRQTARERHNADASQPLAGTCKALVKPLAQLAGGLEAQPAPREFHHQPPGPLVAGLADALLDFTGAACIRRGRQAWPAGAFPAFVNLPPAEQFLDQGPCAAGADTREPRQQCDRGLCAAANLLLLLCFKCPDLHGNQRQPLKLAFNLGAQIRQQLRGLLSPPARPCAPTDALDAQVVQHQQRADPVAVGGALLPQAPELPMHAPLILLQRGWDPRNRPHPPFTRVVSHQHRQQL